MTKQFEVFSLAKRYPDLTVVSRNPIDMNKETTFKMNFPEKGNEGITF